MFYVAVKEGCGVSYKAKQEFRPGGFNYAATGYVESQEFPWQMFVRALNLTTGERNWEYKQVNSRHYGAGLVSTAGGLIFAGDDQGFFTALDAESGEPFVALQHRHAHLRLAHQLRRQRPPIPSRHRRRQRSGLRPTTR